MTLIDWIEHQMLADDDCRVEQSTRLRRIYETATAHQQAALDAALICLCGWTMTHALNMAEHSAEGDAP